MFIELLKEYRLLTNQTQSEIAAILNISTNHLSRLERGLSFPSGDLINRIIELISSDKTVRTEKSQNHDLFGLIIMVYFARLDEIERKIIFHETMRLIKLSHSFKSETSE